jgi:Flp pilus assembly protein TadB
LSAESSAIEHAVAPALDEIAAALRSGGTLRDGLVVASRGGALAPALRTVLARIDAGSSSRDALAELARCHPIPSVQLAIAAATMSLEGGAAQAATLEAVAQRVRERIALEREIHSLSSAARASAAVIALAPFGFMVLVGLIDPRVVNAALHSGVGPLFLAGGLAFEAVGAWWMQQLLRAPLRPQQGKIAADLPELVDLLSLALAAGCTVPLAIHTIAPYARGPCGSAIRVTTARLAAGVALSGELMAWPDVLGEGTRPMVAALVAAHHDGAPVVDALERIAADLRHARRHEMAAQVQRLPVALLFPLVCCVFPAFVLLTVLPITVGSLGALHGVS